uniref:Uncharacterized protein n=1 Tax=Mycena chlorophos TaxID=658473 RepID=A0ABQ0LDP2_MYCCL|nr:predicted protein [Mycena chlorophos]
MDNIPLNDIYHALWSSHSVSLKDLCSSEGLPSVEAPADSDERLVGEPALRRLKLFGTNYLYSVLLQPALRRYTNSLTALSFDGFGAPFGDHIALGLELAALCSATLEDLTVIFNSWRIDEHNTLQHRLPNLRNLTVISEHQQFEEISSWTLPRALTNLLHDASKLPALTKLAILVGIATDNPIDPPFAPRYVLSPHFAELDEALLPYFTSSAITVELGIRHHLMYEPETPEERRADLEEHHAAFSDALRGGLARAFAVGLKFTKWVDGR